MTNKTNQCDVEGVLNEAQGSCVTQHLPSHVAVEYEIHFDTSLRVPYAFHWNGVKQPDGRIAKTPKGQIATIRALVKQGDKIGIYLGSDASPDFRKELLYPITAGSNDIKVVIKTKPGKNNDVAEVEAGPKNVATAHGDKQDQYKGALTGDIWMRFSHCYTAQEAAAYLQQAGETDTGMAAALATIYGGSVTKDAGFSVQFTGKPTCKVNFQPGGTDGNCTENIKNGYSFGGQCLPRVHPRAWIAVLQAARDSGTTSLEISSSWRPMLGSAAHRLGLGFDVKSVKDAKGNPAVFDRSNTKLWSSDEEKTAHADWVESEKELDAAGREQNDAQTGLKNAKGAEGKVAAEQRKKAAADAATKAIRKREVAKKGFQDAHNGTITDTFEQALLKNPLVKQLYDPILMDDDTQDKVNPSPNRLRPGNEAMHKNHLHITAQDRYLIP